MKSKTVVATICWHDNPEKQIPAIIRLLELAESSGWGAIDVACDIANEDEQLVIKLQVGFDCITLSLKDVKEVLEVA